MEAKDTVMSDEDMKGYIRSHLDEIFSKPDAWASERMLVQFQAEISFGAGGKEVVEWIRKRYTKPAGHSFWVLITDDEWQAKLKEWGID